MSKANYLTSTRAQRIELSLARHYDRFIRSENLPLLARAPKVRKATLTRWEIQQAEWRAMHQGAVMGRVGIHGELVTYYPMPVPVMVRQSARKAREYLAGAI